MKKHFKNKIDISRFVREIRGYKNKLLCVLKKVGTSQREIVVMVRGQVVGDLYKVFRDNSDKSTVLGSCVRVGGVQRGVKVSVLGNTISKGSGSISVVVAHSGNWTLVRLRSKKEMHIRSSTIVRVGVVCSRGVNYVTKAGYKINLGIRRKVSRKTKNRVDR